MAKFIQLLILCLFFMFNVNSLVLHVIMTNSTSANVSWTDSDQKCQSSYILKVDSMKWNYNLKTTKYEIAHNDTLPLVINGLMPGYMNNFHLSHKSDCDHSIEQMVQTVSSASRPLEPEQFKCDLQGDMDDTINLRWKKPKITNLLPEIFARHQIEEFYLKALIQENQDGLSAETDCPGRMYQFHLQSDSNYSSFNHLSDEVRAECQTHPLPPRNLTSNVMSPSSKSFIIYWHKPNRSDIDAFNIYLNEEFFQNSTKRYDNLGH